MDPSTLKNKSPIDRPSRITISPSTPSSSVNEFSRWVNKSKTRSLNSRAESTVASGTYALAQYKQFAKAMQSQLPSNHPPVFNFESDSICFPTESFLTVFATALVEGNSPHIKGTAILPDSMMKKLGHIGTYCSKIFGKDPRIVDAQGNIHGSLGILRDAMRRDQPIENKVKQAFTLPLARKFITWLRLHSPLSPYDTHLLEAIILFGIWTLLRPCQWLSPKIKFFNPKQTLSRRDLVFHKNPRSFTYHTRLTKTESGGLHSRPHFYIADSIICPYAALSRHLNDSRHVGSHSPIFIHQDGRFVTRNWVSQHFKKLSVLSGLGSDWKLYDLRRGGATSLTEIGAPSEYIKHAGRWKSDCYTRYTGAFSQATHLKFTQQLDSANY